MSRCDVSDETVIDASLEGTVALPDRWPRFRGRAPGLGQITSVSSSNAAARRRSSRSASTPSW